MLGRAYGAKFGIERVYINSLPEIEILLSKLQSGLITPSKVHGHHYLAVPQPPASPRIKSLKSDAGENCYL